MKAAQLALVRNTGAASLRCSQDFLKIGMLMDWREMAGRPTVLRTWNETLPSTYSWVWRSGSKTPFPAIDHTLGTGSSDPYRGWIIAASWLLACSAEYVLMFTFLPSMTLIRCSIYYLYTFVRRPRMILDFALTLVFNHLVLTTYYSATIPTSLFFWAILATGAAITIIAAEQLCVKREMTEGLNVGPAVPEEEELEMEAGQSSRTRMP